MWSNKITPFYILAFFPFILHLIVFETRFHLSLVGFFRRSVVSQKIDIFIWHKRLSIVNFLNHLTLYVYQQICPVSVHNKFYTIQFRFVHAMPQSNPIFTSVKSAARFNLKFSHLLWFTFAIGVAFKAHGRDKISMFFFTSSQIFEIKANLLERLRWIASTSKGKCMENEKKAQNGL